MTDLPIYESLAIAERDGLASLTTVAHELERKLGTVHMWTKRRRTTRFPMPKAVYRSGSKFLHLYNLQEVKAWHKEYVPNSGGAPVGNRNWVPRSHKPLTP